MMSPHFDRGLLLYEQSRPDLAESELRRALADDPNHPMAHSLLALCLSQRGQLAEAHREADDAVGLAPDEPFTHYALASVLLDRGRLEEAERAIREAIRLDPEQPDYRAVLSGIHAERKHWHAALEEAEDGLGLDPGHVGCANLKALALNGMGRKAEAGEALAGVLARDPNNAVSHANQGWALLDRGDPKGALDHFREALRIDPNLEWAQAGIVEALKARHLLYRLMLRYFLFMAKLGAGAQWLIILGGYFGFRVLRGMAQENPRLAPYVLPLLILYLVFALLTWVADPLFNLLLRLNRFGRMVLSRDQVTASNWVGVALVVALVALVGGLALLNPAFLLLAAGAGVLIVPIAATFRCANGWPRLVMTAYTAALAGTGLTAFLMLFTDPDLSATLGSVFVIGAVLSTWVGNGLGMVRERR